MQGIHLGFETQGRHNQKSKNRGVSSPTKRTYVLQKFLKKDFNPGVNFSVKDLLKESSDNLNKADYLHKRRIRVSCIVEDMFATVSTSNILDVQT